MNQQHQIEENRRTPRAEAVRLTQAEAEAVIALWAEKQKAQEGVDALPTTGDVAETLGTTVEQVEQMLHEVRLRAKPVQKAKVRERIPASSARVRRTVTLALSLYLLSPIPVAFMVNHFGNRDFSRVDALYAPLSWLQENTALRAPLGLYDKLLQKL